MAQIDAKAVQLTLGIVGVGDAPVDLLIHQGRKLGLDRESLEAVPVVRFGLRPQLLDRSIIVVMSAAPLDVLQADAVLAVDNGEPGLTELLDAFDLLPLDAAALTAERLMNGAGRADPPVMLMLNATMRPSVTLEGVDTATIDLETGDGISAAVNPIVSRVASLLASGERSARECPTLVLHASHFGSDPEDLGRVGFPRPGARIALEVSLHEPFGEGDDVAWSCSFAGAVDTVAGPHVVRGTVDPAGRVPPALQGSWQVELFREREIWILRSMTPSRA